jgi:hypothetical protein
MFGINEDKIKKVFADFKYNLGTQKSSDPVVQVIVNFILALSNTFD